MKALILGIAMAVVSAISAQARIGESREQIAARYGNGKQLRERLPETVQVEYHKSGFTIDVVFQNGRSIWELFKREDMVLTDGDIKSLLGLLATGRWEWAEKERLWISQDGRLNARREPGHPDFFSTQDMQAVRAIEDRHKADVSGL